MLETDEEKLVEVERLVRLIQRKRKEIKGTGRGFISLGSKQARLVERYLREYEIEIREPLRLR